MRVNPNFGARSRAFTLVEIMVAIAIFMLMMGSILACWKSIVIGTQTGETAAAMAQRARASMRAVEDSLNNLEVSAENIRYYLFNADTTTDPQFASLSFTARLPSSFLGSDYFGDAVMRRVSFHVEPGAGDKLNLVMSQYPVLAITNQYPPKSIVLARDVSAFVLEFWSPTEQDWLSEFHRSNEVPPMIRITLGTGHMAHDPKIPFEVISRVVAPPTRAH